MDSADVYDVIDAGVVPASVQLFSCGEASSSCAAIKVVLNLFRGSTGAEWHLCQCMLSADAIPLLLHLFRSGSGCEECLAA